MADREPDLCPEGAHPLLAQIQLDETAFLRGWDADIRRAARAAARGDGADEEDLVQQVRARLLIAKRAFPGAPVCYLRVVIANTLRSELRRENRRFTTRSPMAQELGDDLVAPVGESDDGRAASVAVWTTRLPKRLQEIYLHLYAEERSQSETAAIMSVSQPRVAQLHSQLLKRGRAELACLAG